MKFCVPGILLRDAMVATLVYSCKGRCCISSVSGHLQQSSEKVEINLPVELIYRPVKAAVSDQGRIFLEVHGRTYGRIKKLGSQALEVIGQLEVLIMSIRRKAGPC